MQQGLLHSVHHPSPFSAGVGGEPPTKFSKRGGLTGTQLFEGVARKDGGDFFQGELQFSQAKIFFSVVAKNSNWKILTKNLVTFKR